MPTNPVIFFEIPVDDLDRAERFYSKVFGFSFERENIDGYEMTFFPFYDNKTGITGALAKGDVYQPSTSGVILYFFTADIDQTLEKVLLYDGTILYPKVFNDQYGFYVAEFKDTEGNRIAIQQPVIR